MEQLVKEIMQEENMMDKQEQEVATFYEELIHKVTNKQVEIKVDEISDGKYGVEVVSQDQIFWMMSKAWDGAREILENVNGVVAELQLI